MIFGASERVVHAECEARQAAERLFQRRGGDAAPKIAGSCRNGVFAALREGFFAVATCSPSPQNDFRAECLVRQGFTGLVVQRTRLRKGFERQVASGTGLRKAFQGMVVSRTRCSAGLHEAGGVAHWVAEGLHEAGGVTHRALEGPFFRHFAAFRRNGAGRKMRGVWGRRQNTTSARISTDEIRSR